MEEHHVLIIVGAAAVCYGVVSALRLKSSSGWPPVCGRVTRSVKKVEYGETGRLEDADIAYEYAFGGKTYTGKVVKIGGDMLSPPPRRGPSAVDLLLAKYPAGKAVEVYVNPRHPKVACLEKAGAETVLYSVLCGVVAVLAGVYFTEVYAFVDRGVDWLLNWRGGR